MVYSSPLKDIHVQLQHTISLSKTKAKSKEWSTEFYNREQLVKEWMSVVNFDLPMSDFHLSLK